LLQRREKIDLVSPALRQLSIRTRMRAADPSVGLAVDRTGALLVADDVGGIAWRVLY